MSTDPSPVRSRRRWWRRFVLLALGVVLVTEVALRITTDPEPIVTEPDAVLGTTLRPGLSGRHPEGGRFHVNSQGWRGDEAEPTKPANTFRIGVLGDEMTVSFAVDDDHTWCERLERELPATPGVTVPAVEVLNFGGPDWSTAQELLAWRTRVSQFQLDLLLLAFDPRDDVRDAERALARHTDRPFFDLRDGVLVLDDGFLRSSSFRSRVDGGRAWLRRLTDHSRILQLGYRQFRALWPEDSFTEELGLEYAGALLAAPTTTEWTDAWQVTEALIEQLRAEVEASGTEFAVVELTIGELVHPDWGYRRALQRDLGLQSIDYPYVRMHEFSDRTGITLIDLLPKLSDYAYVNRGFLHGHRPLNVGLYNTAGNRVVAQQLAHALVVEGLVPSSATAVK